MKQTAKVQATNRRLQLGATILEAAAVTDTRVVATRFDAFVAIHRRFVESHNTVVEAQAKADTISAQVATAEAAHDAVFDDLLCALVNDHKARHNPVADYGVGSPSRILSKGPADKVAAVAALVSAVLADSDVSPKTREVAEALRSAAQAIALQLDGLAPAEAEYQRLRSTRDALAEEWDEALGALRRGARIAADEGAPNLHAILFGAADEARTRKKRETSSEQPPADDKAAA